LLFFWLLAQACLEALLRIASGLQQSEYDQDPDADLRGNWASDFVFWVDVSERLLKQQKDLGSVCFDTLKNRRLASLFIDLSIDLSTAHGTRTRSYHSDQY
jgi:hypothetical protein